MHSDFACAGLNSCVDSITVYGVTRALKATTNAACTYDVVHSLETATGTAQCRLAKGRHTCALFSNPWPCGDDSYASTTCGVREGEGGQAGLA